MKHQRNGIFEVISLCVFALLGACSLSGPIREDKKASTYQFRGPQKGWTLTDLGVEADQVFLHTETGSVLSVNSLCDRYESASLSSLMKSMLAPLGSQQNRVDKTLILDGREALQSRLEARVDGVAVEVIATVLRKDNCIFDFHLQGVKPLREPTLKDYQQALESFHYRKYGGL